MGMPRAIDRQERVVALIRSGLSFAAVAVIEDATSTAIAGLARRYKARTGRNASNRWGNIRWAAGGKGSRSAQ